MLTLSLLPSQKALVPRSKLADNWDAALLFAQQSLAKFAEPAYTTKMLEENSSKAVELLTLR